MRKKVNITLDPETLERLRAMSDKEHKSMSQWITDIVWIKSREEKQLKTEKK